MTQLTKSEFKKLVDFAFDAYEYHHIDGNYGAGYYRQGGATPFITHPIFAGALLIADRKISEDERILGYKILILHDIVEDTDQELPDWIEVNVREGVQKLTHTKAEEQNREKLKEKILNYPPFFKLLILADMTSNLYEEHVSESKRKEWIKTVEKLAMDVEEHYGETRLTTVAMALVKSTDW